MIETSKRQSTWARLDDPAVRRLVVGLEHLAKRQDRASLAALRRGLGKEPGEAVAVFPVLMPLLPEGRLRPWDERVAYLVASLFAVNSESWQGEAKDRWRRNFGASLHELAGRKVSGGPERRFLALLGSDADDLSQHLRGLVTLLANAQPAIPVEWHRLTQDLLAWDRPDRRVQRQWAEAFWPRIIDDTAGKEDDDEF